MEENRPPAFSSEHLERMQKARPGHAARSRELVNTGLAELETARGVTAAVAAGKIGPELAGEIASSADRMRLFDLGEGIVKLRGVPDSLANEVPHLDLNRYRLPGYEEELAKKLPENLATAALVNDRNHIAHPEQNKTFLTDPASFDRNQVIATLDRHVSGLDPADPATARKQTLAADLREGLSGFRPANPAHLTPADISQAARHHALHGGRAIIAGVEYNEGNPRSKQGTVEKLGVRLDGTALEKTPLAAIETEAMHMAHSVDPEIHKLRDFGKSPPSDLSHHLPDAHAYARATADIHPLPSKPPKAVEAPIPSHAPGGAAHVAAEEAGTAAHLLEATGKLSKAIGKKLPVIGAGIGIAAAGTTIAGHHASAAEKALSGFEGAASAAEATVIGAVPGFIASVGAEVVRTGHDALAGVGLIKPTLEPGLIKSGIEVGTAAFGYAREKLLGSDHPAPAPVQAAPAGHAPAADHPFAHLDLGGIKATAQAHGIRAANVSHEESHQPRGHVTGQHRDPPGQAAAR